MDALLDRHMWGATPCIKDRQRPRSDLPAMGLAKLGSFYGQIGTACQLRDIFVTPLPPPDLLPTYPAVMHARESRMTPQERQLVDELFDRLAGLENNPRDPDAERIIGDGVRRAPHAVYALVQTALVMDEALKRANARIEELQAQVGGDEEHQPSGGFLDSMRNAVLGPRGSVPSVRPQPQPSSAPPPYQSQGGYPPPQMPPYPAGPGTGPGMGPPFGGGGSFLGTAASTAAGVVGGGLLLDSIRSMFGHHSGLGGQSAFGGSGSSADSSLAHAAGIDSIRHGGAAERQNDQALADQDRRDDLEADNADQVLADQDRRDDWEADNNDSDFADDNGDFGGDDSDFA
jgi:uncharacterized protein